MRKLLAVLLLMTSGAACAQPVIEETGLLERSELLPASLSMADFAEPPPETAVVADAHLFATPFYGPQVYLLVVRLDFEEIAPALRSNRVTSKLVMRPAEQRLWVTLLRLPGDQWPADGKPEVLASLSGSLPVGCADSSQILASSTMADLGDAGDGDISISAALAGWRQGQEPVLMIDMRSSSNGSGGGSHFSEAWYLSNGRYALNALACAPASAGYWSKPSYDLQGIAQEDAADVAVTWTLGPGKTVAEDATPSLELREHEDAGKPGRVVARYLWNYDGYQLQAKPVP